MSANFDPMGATIPQHRKTTPAAGYTGLGPTAAKLASQDPGTAYTAYRLQNGMTARSKNKYADFKASLFGQALASLINLDTTQNPGRSLTDINDIISKFSGSVQDGSMYDLLGNTAAQAAGRIDFNSLDDPDAEKFMKLIGGAAGLGQSSIGASSIQSRLDDILHQYGNDNVATDYEADPLGGRFKGSSFAQALAALGFK